MWNWITINKNSAINYQIRISPEDLLLTLRIWKSAEPITTNRNMPRTIGPIWILSSFFYIINDHTVDFFLSKLDDECLSLLSFISWSFAYIRFLVPLHNMPYIINTNIELIILSFSFLIKFIFWNIIVNTFGWLWLVSGREMWILSEKQQIMSRWLLALIIFL